MITCLSLGLWLKLRQLLENLPRFSSLNVSVNKIDKEHKPWLE
ncbi:hypothetical protein QWZ16_10585 [Vibrio ostreicida]|uniref:Uncharacterized protein n=1 Tax=Vibrio ostreicida TaxID=526588 RepID=A0ABT8BVL7_9VIBR|nr:hypothetical protein [Vibrio ostreicida]MDN3610147.1 hypothetical protein [Vibrio ostreicida]